MAIYQFYFAVFPSEGLRKIKGGIPDKLTYNDLTGFFEDKSVEFWRLSNIDSKIIISEVDKLIPRSNWGNEKYNYKWKFENGRIDNDVWISLNEKDEFIEEFSFRVDLRQEKLSFLLKMIELANKYNLIFNDFEGNVVSPSFLQVKKLIQKNKRAYNCIKDRCFFNNYQTTSH